MKVRGSSNEAQPPQSIGHLVPAVEIERRIGPFVQDAPAPRLRADSRSGTPGWSRLSSSGTGRRRRSAGGAGGGPRPQVFGPARPSIGKSGTRPMRPQWGRTDRKQATAVNADSGTAATQSQSRSGPSVSTGHRRQPRTSRMTSGSRSRGTGSPPGPESRLPGSPDAASSRPRHGPPGTGMRPSHAGHSRSGPG